MSQIRLRHVAKINPPTPRFDRLPADAEVTFLPLEAVWPDSRFDTSRRRLKLQVEFGYTRFQCGDILVPKITPTFEADRSTIVTHIEGCVGAGTTELHVVRPNTGVSGRYLNYLLSTRQFLLGGQAEMIGVAGQKRVPDQWLRDLIVPTTNIAIQERVADLLDAETARIDALIAKKRILADTTRERFLVFARQTVCPLVSLFDPLNIRHSDINGNPVAPARLSWRFRIGSGTTPRSDISRYYASTGIPWIVTGDLRDNHIDQSSQFVTNEALVDHPALVLHDAGSVIVAMYGATIGRLGRLRVPATVNQACCVISPRDDDLPEFVFYWLLAFRRELMDRGRGAGQPNISQEVLRGIRIGLPSPREQRRIIDILDKERIRADEIVRLLARQIGLLQEHRQALITEAVTGEMEVPGVRR